MNLITHGHVNLSVTIKELESIDFQDYFQCYQQTPTIEKYYNKHNSSIWQKFDNSPQWVHDLAQKLPQDFEHHVVSVINIPPGQTIPWHADKHYILQKNFGFGDTWRYLIFLEDWKPGHYFEIDQTPVVNWKAGDWIKFHRDDWHLAGNMGFEPFYSAQITVK
jgi:hypothetical protein